MEAKDIHVLKISGSLKTQTLHFLLIVWNKKKVFFIKSIYAGSSQCLEGDCLMLVLISVDQVQ